MFRFCLLLILAFITNFRLAQAKSCDLHLSYDSKTLTEGWKRFTLTAPDSDVSIASKPIVTNYYEQLLQQKIEDRLKNYSDQIVGEFIALTTPKLLIHIEQIRAEIYQKWETNKVTYWGKDDKYYAQEITAIKEYIKILDGYFDNYIDLLINDEFIYASL